MARDISLVLDGFSYTECPRWHEGRLWFADFYTHRVLSSNADGTDVRLEAEVPQQPSGLGWLPDGRLLIVSMRDSRLLRREQSGDLAEHADLSDVVTGHPNDMVVDEQGRAYVGNFGFDLMAGAPIESATIARVDVDGTVTVAAEGLLFPNGSVITREGVLIVSETFGNRIAAFDVGTDGSLSGRRNWARFGDVPATSDIGEALPQLVVAPDGLCLDAEGAVWVADALHGRVLRVRQGGDILEEIHVDSGVFACMLGGDDGRTLFMSAAPDFDEHARSAAREARVLSVQVDVPHAGRP
jgi:sugar lactone lactonase YvrE